MSRHLNGYHPSICFFCAKPLGVVGKYLRFVTRTMWIYTCDGCRERPVTALRGSVSNDLLEKDSRYA